MPTVFEWNERKDRANRKKHGVGFSEAALVFADPLARIFQDEDHSSDEYREIIIGHSPENRLSNKTMKKTSEIRKNNDELRTEYRFDYSKSKANRFAARTRRQGVAVLLDPDIARVFKSAESVNKALRALISVVPRQRAVSAR